jgi:glycosyltransferase involved in cell wall biosynthesis
LPLYYAASDSVIVPSRLQESFGLTLAEGMASGKPVIGSHIPGVRVVVEDGVNGFLIPPGDQRVLTARIHQLAEDAALRQRMGQAGRQRIVQHFTWQKVAERLHSLYQDVLNQS